MGKASRATRAPQTTDERTEALKAASREANEAIRGLREIMTELTEFRRTFPTEARAIFDQVAKDELKSYTDEAVDSIKKYQQEIEAGVAKRIEKIMEGLSHRRFRAPSLEEILAAERVIEWMRDGEPVGSVEQSALVRLVSEYRQVRARTAPDPLKTLTPLPPPSPKTTPAPSTPGSASS